MTRNTVDGFSFDQWLSLFRSIKEQPQRFVDAMSSPTLPKLPGVEPDLLLHQRDLRKKVARKFSNPHHWVWSSDYLQLASDQATARMVASYYPAGCEIIDAGCGGGSDSVALSDNRRVIALDKNEFACQLTQCNGLLQQSEGLKGLETRQAAIEDMPLSDNAFLHLDPDRRQDGRRSVQMQWHSPDLETVARLILNTAGGSIKLAPACSDDHANFGKCITKQWISVHKNVVQQRWWWGTLSSVEDHVRVSAFNESEGWIHEFIPNHPLHYQIQPVILSKSDIKPEMYIGDGDPALRASNCQHMYISHTDCAIIGNSQGFYLSHHPLDLPLIRWQKIAAVLPLDSKRIKEELRRLGFDGVELKSRNIRSIPSDLAKLALKKGTHRASVFACSLGRSHLAIIGAGSGNQANS